MKKRKIPGYDVKLAPDLIDQIDLARGSGGAVRVSISFVDAMDDLILDFRDAREAKAFCEAIWKMRDSDDTQQVEIN